MEANKFIKVFFLTICIYSTMNSLNAQVKSGSFNFTLKMLLRASTPVIDISNAANAFKTYIFLDAREYHEYEVSHIFNARYVGDKNFNIASLADLPKNTPIVVYCSIGKRSEDVTLKMIKTGYTNVKNLYGGIFEWVNHGYKLYNTNNLATDSIHAFSKFWGNFLDKGIKIYK